MTIEGYVDYRRREFCQALPCPVQALLDEAQPDSPAYDRIRSICQSSCIHSTYEFHHWLIERGYLIIRPAGS